MARGGRDPGSADGGGDRGELRALLAVSRFNRLVTDRLEQGARGALLEAGIPEDRIEAVRVAGAWELPYAVRRAQDDYDLVVALGCVVRGETPHFEYVCEAATQGLMTCQAEGSTPVGFGLLTTETEQQGLQRAGGKQGNKGAEAAEAALELVDRFAEDGGDG